MFPSAKRAQDLHNSVLFLSALEARPLTGTQLEPVLAHGRVRYTRYGNIRLGTRSLHPRNVSNIERLHSTR